MLILMHNVMHRSIFLMQTWLQEYPRQYWKEKEHTKRTSKLNVVDTENHDILEEALKYFLNPRAIIRNIMKSNATLGYQIDCW